ncbi:unnamed protein product [Brassica rapa]|uniref:Thioredoxin domain-containing protein n=1 Tax=Brassica campestris TaxID=3711 RepID=A0A8D9HST7_BRACM|nr:unnamed protein product [Brassica rapa]
MRPWTPRFESHISPYKVNIPLIVEIKNKNQFLMLQLWRFELWVYNNAYPVLVFIYIACDRVHGQMSVWMEYNLHTLPAIVFMKRGQEVDRVVGVKFDELERKLHKYVQSFF